jgi:hypothetical protein
MTHKAIIAALAASALFANSALAASVKIPEGMEFPLRIEEELSSRTSTEGDRFTISLADDVALPDGTVLRSGYRGVGEIVEVQKSGRVGRKGTLNIRVNYIRVGDDRINLRASKGAEGSGNTGNMVAAIVFAGVFGLLVKGKNAEIPKGARVTAFANSDVEITTPVPAPPPEA